MRASFLPEIYVYLFTETRCVRLFFQKLSIYLSIYRGARARHDDDDARGAAHAVRGALTRTIARYAVLQTEPLRH